MKNQVIYPELGQTTDAQIEIKTSYSSAFYLTTDLELNGRGIRQSGDGTDHKRGKKTYHCTEKALEKLKQKYSTCFIASFN